jgi:hypothetical protein
MQITDLCPRPEAFAEARNPDFIPVTGRFPAKAEGRISKIMRAMEKAYSRSYGIDLDLGKLPIAKQRLLAGLAENVMTHHKTAISRGRPDALLRGTFEALNSTGLAKMQRALYENVTSSDIADFTTQQLAFIVDVFADFLAPELFTTIVMTGPTAYVHRRTLTRDGGGVGGCAEFYDANAALVDGLAPGCSECPTECSTANGIDVEVTAELVEATCRRLKGTYCIPANWHYSSQYGGSLAAVLQEGIEIELRRHIQAHLLSVLDANAGGTRTWNQTPAAGSYFESANPREWKQELWNSVKAANRAMLNAAQGRSAGTHLIGDVNAIGHLEDAVPMEFVDNQPGDVNTGRGDETSVFLGRTKQGRYEVMRFLEGMPEDTLLLLNRNDSDPTAIYAPWIPITNLGVLQYPAEAKVDLGAITLYGVTVTRSARIQEIVIGA